MIMAVAGFAAVAAAAGGRVQFTGRYFRDPDGSLFVPLGGFYGNWVPVVEDGVLATMRPFQDCSPDEWRAWFSLLRDHGCTAVRVFCRAHATRDGNPVEWTLDAGGHVNPDLMARFEAYFAAGYEHGIRFLMTVLSEPRGSIYTHWAPILFAREHYLANGWDWNAFVPEDINARRLLQSHAEYFTDPEAVALQKQYLAELIPRLAANPAVMAVELYNEMGWDGQLRWAEQPLEIAWSNEMVSTIRLAAIDLPTCFSLAGHGMTGIDPLKWCSQVGTDFMSTHFYPSISGESEDLDYAGTAALLHDYCAALMPNWPGEAGPLDAVIPDDLRRLALRDSIWLTLVSGGAGFMQWPLDRQPVAHLDEYRKARDFLDGQDWLLGELAVPDVAVDIRQNADFLAVTEDRDAKLASPLFDALRRYERLSLDRGVRLELRLGLAVADGAIFDPTAFDGIEPPFVVPPGYQMRGLEAADGGAGIAYFRNTELTQHGPYRLRKPALASFGLSTDRLEGRYRFDLLELDSGRMQEVTVEVPGVIMPERTTTADFAVRYGRR